MLHYLEVNLHSPERSPRSISVNRVWIFQPEEYIRNIHHDQFVLVGETTLPTLKTRLGLYLFDTSNDPLLTSLLWPFRSEQFLTTF